MNDFFKSNKKMLFRLLLLVILFPLIILIKSPIGIIPKEIGLSILSYGGAILGGFLTLYGVWWTIVSTKTKEEKERALQYRPVLQYDICKIKHNHQQSGEINFMFNDDYFDNSKLNYLEDKIQLKNVGRGETNKINLVLSDVEIFSNNLGIEDMQSYQYKSYFLGNNYIDFLPVNGSIYIHIGVPSLINETMLNKNKDLNICLKGNLIIEHTGFLSEQIYLQTLRFHIRLELKNGKHFADFYNTSLDLKILSPSNE